MKTLRFLLLFFMVVLLFISCRKDNGGFSSTDLKTPQKIEDLNVKSTFDWKTVKEYQITLSGSTNHTIQIVSPDGSVYYKAFLKANTPSNVTVLIPSYETCVHLLYYGENIELPLTGSTLSYSFQ